MDGEIQMQEVIDKLAIAKKKGSRIIYIDETMVTRKTVARKEYCHVNKNMTIDDKKLNEPTLALLAGISFEYGLEHFQIFEKSVDIPKF